MEIELKDFLEGTSKQIPDEAIQANIEEVIKSLIKKDLKEEAKNNFSESCRVFRLIIQNIINNPEEEKYKIIKLKNPKFQKALGNYTSGLLLLETIGFEKIDDVEPFMIYINIDLMLLQKILNVIDKATSRSELIADMYEQKFNNPKPYPMPILNKKDQDTALQIQQYRSKHKNNRPFGAKVITLSDLENRSNPVNNFQTNPQAVYNSIPSFTSAANVAIRAFELSNAFRISEGKCILIWNQIMGEIAAEHSKNMGDGVVPFGHQGFNKRFRRFPFRSNRGGAENVAMNHGLGDPGKVAVDGWIKSPGHRKNLLGNYRIMSVGVYINSQGAFYLTQLFALV
ncbi:hypothetical protein SteCoe_29622 [Stentor coeruleus]|uniref:SCP domain-containing protein n=1 Tax=Stentor coeruleus TaxID=5963 RepID=A0A1R2B5I8_9CILI|nr:hypothetical protein SteCoe_29622 [Stentor coeruleus]